MHYNRIRKIILMSMGTMIAVSIGCKKISELLSFTIRNESSFEVSSVAPVSTPFNIFTPDVQTGSEQEFENNKTKAGLVKDIRLTSMELTITSPTGKTFSFLKSVNIYISTAEGTDEVKIAYANNIDPNSNAVNLSPAEVNLDKYLKGRSYKLRTEVVTRQVVTENITIRVNSSFRVSANL